MDPCLSPVVETHPASTISFVSSLGADTSSRPPPSPNKQAETKASRIQSLEQEIAVVKSDLDTARVTLRDRGLSLMSGRVTPLVVSQTPLTNLKVRKVLKQHLGKVLCVDWSPDGVHLCSSSTDGSVIIWHGPSQKPLHTLNCQIPWIIACAYGPSLLSHVICYGGLDNRCTIVRIPHFSCPDSELVKATFACHTSFLSCCRFLGGEQQLLTGSGDGTSILWDVEGEKAEQTFRAVGTQVTCLDTNPANPWSVFGTGCGDNIARVYDIRSGKCEMMLEGHVSEINSVKFIPSGDCFITGSDDGTCRLYDLRSDQELQVFTRDSIVFGVSSVDTSLSGRILFSAHDDSSINVWDIIHGERLVNYLNFHDDKITRLRVSPDGCGVATSSWDSSVKIWC